VWGLRPRIRFFNKKRGVGSVDLVEAQLIGNAGNERDRNWLLGGGANRERSQRNPIRLREEEKPDGCQRNDPLRQGSKKGPWMKGKNYRTRAKKKEEREIGN